MLIEPSITIDHIRSYRRDGAVLIKGALDVAALGLLQRGVEEAYEAQARRSTEVNAGPGHGATVVKDYASQDSPSLSTLLADGTVGRIGAALMETPSAQLVLDQVFYKTKGPILPTPWHQDTPFLRVRGMDLIRLWFPCDFSPCELTVQVVRGSHRWNVVYRAGGDAGTARTHAPYAEPAAVGDSWLPQAPDVRAHQDSFEIMRWDVEPGDVLAFQGNMLHGTDGNPAHDRPRRAFAVLLGGPDLRYHAPEGKAFPSPGRMRRVSADHSIPDGAPIGDHPKSFPICWPVRADHVSG